MDEQRTANLDKVFFFAFIGVFTLINIILFSKSNGLELNKEGIGIALAAFFTLSLYSFLYKDNPLFKFTEHFFVGVGMGVNLVIVYFDIIKKELFSPLIEPLVKPDVYRDPNWGLLIPIVFGLFMFGRFFKQLSFLSRFSFAFVVGFGAGISIPNTVHGFLLKQMEASLIPLKFSPDYFTVIPIIFGIIIAALVYLSQKDGPLAISVLVFFFLGAFADTNSLNALLSLVGVISVLIYFFFSLEHKGIVGGVSKVGIWFLMLSFGASFGYTVMGRMALLVGRVQFLIYDWLKITVS